MICQNCDGPIQLADERCPNCGAKPLHRRVIFGERREEFALELEDESSDVDLGPESSDPWQFTPQGARGERDVAPPPGRESPVRWGGFLRRGLAFVLDLAVLVALSASLGLLSYIGYRAGLSVHDQSLTFATAGPLGFFVIAGCLVLAVGYFVLLHGMGGKTIGKWLLGLRVVGPKQTPIGFKQAFRRLVGTILLAPLILGVLWIIWSREKRAWHDFFAETWVVRE